MKKNFIQALCEQESLKYDKTADTYAGTLNHFPLFLTPTDSGSHFTASFSIKKVTNEFPEKNIMKRLTKECAALSACHLNGHRVTYTIKKGINQKRSLKKIHDGLADISQFFIDHELEPCCEICGETQLPIRTYYVGGKEKILCVADFLSESQHIQAEIENKAKKENIPGGFVGALLGALLAAILMLFIAQLGYVSVWTGTIMGVCTIKGYEWLGSRLTKKGVIISSLIMLIMVYLTNRMDWALTIASELEANPFDIFSIVSFFIKSYDLTTSYFGDLVLLYVFAIGGFAPTVYTLLQQRQTNQMSYEI